MEQWVVPIAVALIAPFFAYLAAARKLSGRIDTTEANVLWMQLNRMSDEWRGRAEECEQQVKALRNEIATVIARNTALRRENQKLRDEIKRCGEHDALA